MFESEKQYEVMKEYFIKIANRVQPLFIEYGWKLCNKVPKTKDIVDFLLELQGVIEEGAPFVTSGRFYMVKDKTNNNIGVRVYADLSESEWEY